jgi:DNA-binding NarL/FixJ family response regulator
MRMAPVTSRPMSGSRADDPRGDAMAEVRTLLADARWEAPILVADDQRLHVRFLDQLLRRAGYQAVHTTVDPFEIVPLCAELHPALLILDADMPGLDGPAVLAALRRLSPLRAPAVLVLATDATPEFTRMVRRAGAQAVLPRPLDRDTFLETVRPLVLGTLLRRHQRAIRRRLQRADADTEALRRAA